MVNIRIIRIYTNFLYVLHDKDTGVNIGATNLTVLARKSGISYGKLRYVFSTQGEDKYEDIHRIVLRVSTGMIFKGGHRLKGGPRPFGGTKQLK